MSFRPEIVECWVFRVPAGGDPEFLLIRRSPGRIWAGLWQPVTGRVEDGERIPLAGLREVVEETAIGPADIDGFYDLDQVSQFYDESRDEVVSSVILAVRVRPDVVVHASHEHDGAEWVSAADAVRRSIWPSYRESIARILALVDDPERARYMSVGPDGRRLAR